MTGSVSTVERLRQFIREISPEARAMLLRELERGSSSGEKMPGAELILQELRELQRGSAASASRLDSSDRRFFQPFVPFLVDGESPEKISGRISRSSLTHIWTWIGRDLLPDEIKRFSDDAKAAVAAGNIGEADRLTREIQDRARVEIEKALQENTGDRKNRQKLVSQIGGESVLDALAEIVAILRIRDTLAGLSHRLPPRIKSLTEAELQTIRPLFEHPALQRPDVFPYALALLFSRLAVPSHLLRLAVAAAETDSAQRIAETPYAFAVDLVIDETARVVLRLADDLHARATSDICSGIKKFHDLARGLTTELDVSVDTRWTRRLSQLRADTARLLRSRIDGLPGQVRRLLRPRPRDEIAEGSTLDPHEISDLASLLEVLGTCRMCAGEIALNEITLRLSSELETCLDNATQALLESIRQSSASDRAFRLSQLNAAVQFSARIFGKRYAELLAKAAEVALQSERRAAQA
jgi:hypothetical protein